MSTHPPCTVSDDSSSSLDSDDQSAHCPETCTQSEETGKDDNMQADRDDVGRERGRRRTKDNCKHLEQLSSAILDHTEDDCTGYRGQVEEGKIMKDPEDNLGDNEEVTRTEDHTKTSASAKMNRVSSRDWLVERAEGSETIKMSEITDIQLIVTEPIIDGLDSGFPSCKIRNSKLDIRLKPTLERNFDIVDCQSSCETDSDSSDAMLSSDRCHRDSDDQSRTQGGIVSDDKTPQNETGRMSTDGFSEFVQLNNKETELATSLRKLVETEGGSKSGGEILQEMGDIHKKRGLLTMNTHCFVTASALYNAALMRTEDPEKIKALEMLVRQNERLFCDTLSLPNTKLPIDFKSEIKEILEAVRRRVSPKAEGLLNNFAKELNLDAADDVRMQVEKVFVDDTRRIFEEVCSSLVSFDQYLISKSKDILGQPPQEYATIAMGS